MTKERTLSIFIDESGDFGPYDKRSPYYFVTLVTHDQRVDIADKVEFIERQIDYQGFPKHAIHAGPLIRREAAYINTGRELRRKLFNTLCQFLRLVDINYITVAVEKKDVSDRILLQAKLTRSLADALKMHSDYFNKFDKLIVYYDNGQIDLTKILVSVFTTLFVHVEFRKVAPVDYVLFQVADLICTIELVAQKFLKNIISRSESEFFVSSKVFKTNYLKWIRKKRM